MRDAEGWPLRGKKIAWGCFYKRLAPMGQFLLVAIRYRLLSNVKGKKLTESYRNPYIVNLQFIWPIGPTRL